MKAQRPSRPSLVLTALLAAGAIGACTGRIGVSTGSATGGGGNNGSGAAGSGSGSAGIAGGAGASDGGAATGSGGTSSVPIVTTGATPAESAGTLVMRRLTYREYDHMLADLLGDTTAPAEGGNAWSPDAPNAV